MQFFVNLVHRAWFWPLLFFSPLISGTRRYSEPVDDHSEALSPDDALFAHLRCFELFASSDPGERELDATNWMGCDERYVEENERTKLFLRCVLGRLGFYNGHERLFNTNSIKKQFSKYQQWMSLSEEAVEQFINDTNNVGRLENSNEETIYEAFEPLFQNHSNTYFQLFLRDETMLQKMYSQELIPVRKSNQTVIQFCELQMDQELWDDICLIRVYEISNRTEAMERHIACIFHGFRYLDEESSIDGEEIFRDFELTGLLNDNVTENIRDCVHNASHEDDISTKSLAMYRCLLSSDSSTSFREAFDFREVRSGNLTFTLQNLPYDRDEVKRQILALDRERCDDQQQPSGRSQDGLKLHIPKPKRTTDHPTTGFE